MKNNKRSTHYNPVQFTTFLFCAGTKIKWVRFVRVLLLSAKLLWSQMKILDTDCYIDLHGCACLFNWNWTILHPSPRNADNKNSVPSYLLRKCRFLKCQWSTCKEFCLTGVGQSSCIVWEMKKAAYRCTVQTSNRRTWTPSQGKNIILHILLVVTM